MTKNSSIFNGHIYNNKYLQSKMPQGHMKNPRTVFTRLEPGGPGARTPLDPSFSGPEIEHFRALFNFSIIFFASLCLAYYFFNILHFHSSTSKIFQPGFDRHMTSHLKVFGIGLSFTHFRLLGVLYKIISN